jgi:hypothetical protein
MITDRKASRPPPLGGSTPTCVGGLPERQEPAGGLSPWAVPRTTQTGPFECAWTIARPTGHSAQSGYRGVV